MTAGTSCLRCGSEKLVSAHLEHPTAFCVDHAAHHGVVRLHLKAALCQECGHVEMYTPHPPLTLEWREASQAAVLQEEDF